MADDELATRFIGDIDGLDSQVPLLERVQPGYYALEVERIFRRAWLPVACASDIPNANDFLEVTVPPLKASLILARASDLTVRAFHNICRHRANPLLRPAERGCRALLRCGFHGWSFSTDGRLVGVTDRSQFPRLDEKQLGLIAVHCEVWEDWVFVNFDKQPRWTLAQWLGKMHGEYNGYFDHRVKIADYKVEVSSPWHVAIGAFSEGYHSLFVHAKTLPDYQGGAGNPNRHRAYLELTQRNGRYSAQSNPNHQPSDVEAFAYRHGQQMYPSFLPFDCADNEWPSGVNPARNPAWAFDVVEFFPHLILLAGINWHANMWFWPIDHERTDVWVEFFAYRPSTVGDHLSHAYFRARLREVFREDVSIMEGIGASLRSGAMHSIVLSDQEMLIRKHFKVAADMVANA